MKIIISPAKQMKVDTDTLESATIPEFISRAEVLKEWIRGLSYAEQKNMWACNDKITKENSERFRTMDLGTALTPALLSFDGIQYTYMAPAVFEDGQYDYVQEHLRILSGFYGVLNPMDGVVPYRLEIQAKVDVAGCRNLYDFWGDSLYREIRKENHHGGNFSDHFKAKHEKVFRQNTRERLDREGHQCWKVRSERREQPDHAFYCIHG